MATKTLTKSNRTKAMTLDNSKKLLTLAKEIRTTYQETEDLIISAQKQGCAAIASALICGKALNEAKAIVGHGNWLAWLKKHCKGICERTARNYMAFANRQHVADLKTTDSLRQAYIAVGIIPESNAPEKPMDQPPNAATRKELGMPPAPNPPQPTESEKPTPAPETIEARPVAKSLTGLPVLLMIQRGVDELLERLNRLEPGEQRQAASKILAPLEEWL